MTPEQQSTLKAAILAEPALAAQPSDGDGLNFIADALNADAVPDYFVWRTDVTSGETGNAWVGTDIDGMSALNMQRLQLLLASSPQGVFDMSRADRRAGFENPFGASVSNASRVAMRTAWKRTARRIEKLFATGTGSGASPGTMTFEGTISPNEVDAARRS